MNTMTHLLLGAVAIILLESGATQERAMSQTPCEFQKIAEDHIQSRWPEFDRAGKTLIISESEDVWEITYELPPDMLGGTPVIVIDKSTCKIIRSYITQ
jgi:NTF2 fold immunity protein